MTGHTYALALTPPTEAKSMPARSEPRVRGVAAPPPALRHLRVIWAKASYETTVTCLADDYSGYWTHWIPNGDKFRTTACLGRRHCMWCVNFGQKPDQWTGYMLCKAHGQEGTHAMILTPTSVLGVQPHLARGLRGCVFTFQADRSQKGQPVLGTFQRRTSPDGLPDAFDMFPTLCKLWRVDENLARRVLHPEEALRRPSAADVQAQLGELND